MGVGTNVGTAVAFATGLALGSKVGSLVGFDIGVLVGSWVGSVVGFSVGTPTAESCRAGKAFRDTGGDAATGAVEAATGGTESRATGCTTLNGTGMSAPAIDPGVFKTSDDPKPNCCSEV